MPPHYMAVRHRAGTWYLLCRCSRTFCTFRHLASPGHITCRSANQPFLINASGTSGAGCAAQGGCGAAPTASAAPPSVVPDILFKRKYTDNRVHDAWACVMRSKGTPVTHSGVCGGRGITGHPIISEIITNLGKIPKLRLSARPQWHRKGGFTQPGSCDVLGRFDGRDVATWYD